MSHDHHNEHISCMRRTPRGLRNSRLVPGSGPSALHMRANADGLRTRTCPLEAWVVVFVPILVRGARMQLSHGILPFLVLTPIGVHLYDVTEWTYVISSARRIFHVPRAKAPPCCCLCVRQQQKSMRDHACGSPVETWPACVLPIECISGCPSVYAGSVRARTVLAFRYLSELENELIAVGRIDGHS